MKKLDLEEHNAVIFADNSNELYDIFDKGLSSDGGEHWVSPEEIIHALSENGYMLLKFGENVLDDKP